MIRYNRKQDPHINKKPVSIIVTAWQTSQFIEDCLDSIESQTYFASNDNFEVLVGIDGCAQTLKKVEEIAYKYRNLKVFMMESHVGTYVTSNTLLNLASKDHIIRFDSDDIMLPEMVEEVMAQTDNYDFIQYGFKTFTGNKSQTFERKFWAACGSVYYNRSFIDAAGGYRPWLCSADLELIRRTENTSFRRGIIEKRLFLLRSHPNSLASRAETKLGGGYRSGLERGIRVFKHHENINIKRKISEFKSISSKNFEDQSQIKKPLEIIYPKEKNTEPENNIAEISQDHLYFSIVIPTMWRSTKIFEMLEKYEKSDYVKEIILIDNNYRNKPDINFEKYQKIKYYTEGKNIFVNAAWNWGYSLSNYELILANDDIIIENLDEILSIISKSDFDIVGISLDRDNKGLRIDPINKFILNYGVFMFIRNYVKIPDELKIWCGDSILFDLNKKRGALKNIRIKIGDSETLKSNPSFGEIARKDNQIYKNLKQIGYNFNILNKKKPEKKGLGNKEVNKFFSIVIPTMWRCEKILEMLPIYENSPYVKEIIIIDNDPSKTPDLSLYSKIRYYTKGKNIYVNPSWNWGYSLSNYELILANDDIIIKNLNEVLQLISESDYDIIGLDLKKDNYGIRIDSVDEFPEKGYGCFMYIKKYIYIPENMKIWYGDYVFFHENKKRGILKNIDIEFIKSATLNYDNNKLRKEVAEKNDLKVYKSFTQFNKDFNIIIRTSGRPTYFYNCVESIKKSGINAKLHITLDNEDDLKYVEKICEGLDYVYYLIDKEVIENISKKIKIERNLFIYNYYFNIIQPYLNGWCLALDDDDEILINPILEKNINNIYLYKVDVGHKVVPSDRNFEKKPVLNDISGLGIIWHSSQMIDWKPQRGGDYSFISELYEKYPAIWNDEILSKVQTKGNFGKRNDLKDKLISINLATFPPRKSAFLKCIDNLLSIDIIDVIRIYLNEYTEIPDDFPKNNKILYHIGKENLKDSGKFYWAKDLKDEYYFTADDDLIYPKQYFIDHLLLLKKYNDEIFVTSHGKEMKPFPKAFNDNINSYACLKNVKEDVWINNPGTGVMVFDNSKFTIPINMFKYHGMADLWIGYYCQENKIPILCRKHEANELKYLLDKEETLFDKRNQLNEDHQKVLQKIGKWNLYKK